MKNKLFTLAIIFSIFFLSETTFAQFYYCINDHLGNTRVVVDEQGNVKEYYDYYPFGKTLRSSITGEQVATYKFTGKELDDENDLNWYDFGARRYDPEIGRWLVPDPIGQGWSPYIYCNNNLLNYSDREGLYWSKTDSGEVIWVMEETIEVTYDEKTGETTTDTELGTPLDVFLDLPPIDETGEFMNIEKLTDITKELMQFMFVEGYKNSRTPLNLGYVLKNSPTGMGWDIKAYKFTNPFYIVNRMVIGNEPLGNMSWGYIMASGKWPEIISKIGAGGYQLYEHFKQGKTIGPIGTFFDQPADYRAIGYGYKYFRRKQ